MNKILPLALDFPFTTTHSLAWGDGGCSLSNKNKISQDETVEPFDISDFTDS